MAQRLTTVLLICVSFSLCWTVPNVHAKLVILLVVCWLFARPAILDKRNVSTLVLILGLIVIDVLIGLGITRNTSYAISFIETFSPLLAIPLIVFTSRAAFVGNKAIGNIFLAFVAGVLLLNVASLFFISYDLWDPRNLQINLIEANNVIVKIHPAFLSMYISFCIFFIADNYFPLHKLDRVKLGWVLFSLAVLTVFLLWLNSRAGILAFVLSAIFFISYRWQGRTRWIGFAGLILFLVVLVSIPFSRYRFVEAPKMVLASEPGVNHHDPNIYPIETRMQIYKCDLELLKWPEIMYGYGTGDFRDELQKCFEANNYTAPLAENMDSHSEYFAQLHRHGVIGLGLFLALLIVPFRHALKYRSPLLGAFIILFAVTAMFENVFSAQKGVTFFALFCPLLYIYAKQQYESKADSQANS